jgi:translation initiation factor 1
MKSLIRELDKEQSRIVISKDIRGRYRKVATVISGIQDKNDAEALTKELKAEMGTGGTYKNGQIILQGDHRDSVRQFLVKKGFSSESIEVM